jgi:predicted amidohydrolase YtcJ
VFDTHLVDAGARDPRRLLEAKVLYTIVGGRVVHERGGPISPATR